MSSRELIARYMRERARLRVFAPLALVMAAMGGWTGGRVDGWTGRTVTNFAIGAVAALALVLAFRVWDDLEDRAHDAREYPARVTVVGDTTAPLVALGLVLATAGVLAIGLEPKPVPRLLVAGAAVLVLGLWYRLRGARASRVVNGHLVLLKYPALAFAASTASPSLAALASLYLILCIYEFLDDPALRASIVARSIAISECALVSVIIATATLLGGRVP